MSKPHPRLNIDFETASTADLKRTGSYAYSVHPDTRVLCMAWAFDDDPVQIWREGDPFPQAVANHVAYGGRVDAWNASFEFNIWNHALLRQVPALKPLWLTQLHDTMARAANYGLPLSLDQAASAARVRVLKDKEGHSLMLRMCRPRKINPDGSLEWWHEQDPERFDRLCAYCQTDVEAERAIGNALPEMTDAERQVWIMDQNINQRGVTLDLDLVRRLQALAERAARQGNWRMARLTGGAVNSVNAAAALLAYLKDKTAYPHGDLTKASVSARLDDPDCMGHEREVLELRADVAKTSAAKLGAMLGAVPYVGDILDGTLDTGVVRGLLQYYGAFRTGRWAGRLIQPQNMPRGTISGGEILRATQIIKAATDMDQCYDGVELLFGSVMGVVSSLLRACIIPRPGKLLSVADLAQIEARVLPWLAGQLDVLAAFAAGEDIYVKAAAGIYRVPETAVDKAMRQIGKVAILALGYQGGKGAFQAMAQGYGVVVGDAEAEKIKTAWRDANPKIVDFWWRLDAAARTVIQNPKQIVDVDKLRFGMVGTSLVIRLPSGRPLFYRDAQIITDDDGQTSISYMGLNQYTRKWERLRTYGGKLTENVTQAVARDVMAHGMLTAERAGLEVVLTVHDEILAEVHQNTPPDALENAMKSVPSWAAGLPVGADGWIGDRYRK